MMTLTHQSRLAGPSWDEEVVPALRKRLESESRTLARRMSAISLSSMEDPTTTIFTDTSTRQRQISPQIKSSQQHASGGQIIHSSYQPQGSSDRTMATVTARPNGTVGTKPSSKTDFQRARTYSSPYGSDSVNGHENGKGRTKPNVRAADPTRSLSPRPVDIKPTRIPKASRTPVSQPSSSASSPYANGYIHEAAVKPYSMSPELHSQTTSDQKGTQRGIITSSSTRTTVDISRRSMRQASGLMNESPPFPTDATMSSGFTQPSSWNQSVDESPPRASNESEERPYEHWYRGEVSRNGGVGELRVGRRQEMLDIANYGHMIESRQAAKRMAAMNAEEAAPRSRKRAGSIAGITNMERERGSLYLDEENVDEAGRVLDEHPLTDLDGEGSEMQSLSDAHTSGGAYAYIPDPSDATTPSAEWTTVAGAHEFRSTTPTASMLPRPASRQQQAANPPPTRIPGPSSRRSSESRSTVNSSHAIGGTTYLGVSKQSSPPPAPSSSSNSRPMTHAHNTTPTSIQKRGASPAAKKPRGGAPKMGKSKTLPGKRDEDTNRGSVAYYPSPEGDGEDMADAIPSWTQPVPREGNWDDVVIPVVARKKGLDGHYEDADGSPKPKKVDKTVAPAPGTFGFDGSKYRTPRGDFESIPMDEFGQQAEPKNEDHEQDHDSDPNDGRLNGLPTIHDEIQLPHRQQSPSPAPFAHYAPTSVQEARRSPHPLTTAQIVQHPEPQVEKKGKNKDEDDAGSGCCKCVIM